MAEGVLDFGQLGIRTKPLKGSKSDDTISGTFVFLSEGKENEVRRQVRSRAAQYSHRVGPRRPKSSKKLGQGIAKSKTCRAKSYGKDHSKPHSERSDEVQSPLQLPTAPPSPKYTHVGGYSDDPFLTYPVPPQPWFSKVLSEMWEFMLRGWSQLSITQIERDSALIWVQRLTMSDPSYFYMNLLSVAEDLVQKNSLDSRIPFWLASRVVTTINEALGDSRRSLTAGTIMAVGRIAVHEIVLGDLATGQNIHRPAWARMIVMAGGLDSLALPPLVLAHWGWAERLMARKTGVRITDIEPALKDEPIFSYRPEESQTDISILKGYMPKRQPASDGL